jgi:uncharacterized oligopeptide transporter (OPT) family protein
MDHCDETDPKGLRTATRSTVSGVGELTVPATKVGGLITLLFTAANVYPGAEGGAHVRDLDPSGRDLDGVLRYFADHTIGEENGQTIASAAGPPSAIIFVLPGLIVVG